MAWGVLKHGDAYSRRSAYKCQPAYIVQGWEILVLLLLYVLLYGHVLTVVTRQHSWQKERGNVEHWVRGEKREGGVERDNYWATKITSQYNSSIIVHPFGACFWGPCEIRAWLPNKVTVLEYTWYFEVNAKLSYNNINKRFHVIGQVAG